MWIVSDVRRPTDVIWFKESYPNKIKTIRIDASDETRRKRGWIFTEGENLEFVCSKTTFQVPWAKKFRNCENSWSQISGN